MSDILIPNFGESITTATVAAWHKNAGDTVAKGDTLVTLETDKVSTDLEADESGVLEILVPEGAEAPIGAVLGHISSAAGTAAAPEKEEAPAPPEPEKTTAPETREEPSSTAPAARTESPEQKSEKQMSAPEQNSAGESGKPEKEAPSRFIRKPMSPLRRTIAARLVEAQHQAAILTTFNECDMSAVMELRKQFNAAYRERYGTKLGFMSFFIKAVVKALQEVPQVNARIDGTDIVENLYYDISVAIGTDQGPRGPRAAGLRPENAPGAGTGTRRPDGKSARRKLVHAGPARGLLHHLQRGNLRFPALHPHSEPAPERHSGHARHSGTPHGPGRPDRRPAHDVPGPFL